MTPPPAYRLIGPALAGTLLMAGQGAHALSLGAVTVRSALGEPLRAVVAVQDLSPAEAATLRTQMAGPDAFKAAGLEYNAVLGSATVVLRQTTDGRAVLEVSSARIAQEPIVDLLIEATWSGGRLVREYTLLLDPPGSQSAAPADAQLAQSTPLPRAVPAPSAALPAPAVSAAPPRASQRPAAAPVAPRAHAALARRNTASRVQAVPAAAKPARPASDRYAVRSGDTAGAIAAAHKPASVSLDQMLVALLRSNPDAFMGDNVNRLKSGVVLNLPKADQAQQTAPETAREIIVAQSRDFNDYRRKLAGLAPTQAQTAPAGRSARGTVTAAVQARGPEAAAPDKLKLTKPTPGASRVPESRVADQGNQREVQQRQADLQRNIQALQQLAQQAAAPAASAASAAGVAPAAVVVASSPSAMLSAPASVASAAVSPPALPASTASAPRPKGSARPLPPDPAPTEAPSLLDVLLDNPLLPLAGGALLALLGGYGAWKLRQRRRVQTTVDSQYPDSMLGPDSLINSSGGRSVDTADSAATGSSMLYSASQLDAVEGVDPVAEAEVYIAYGRDLQAEEILRDALRASPERMAIHLKLAEIYAKRGDTKGFEAVAAVAYNLCGGTGPDWDHLCELGRVLDPDNRMYGPGGAPDAAPAEPPASEPAHIEPDVAEPMPEVPSGELDLDLDFSSDLSAATAPAPLESLAASAPEAFDASQTLTLTQPIKLDPASVAEAAPQEPHFDLTLDLPDLAPAAQAAPPAPDPAPVAVAAPSLPSLDFALTDEPFAASAPLPVSEQPVPSPAAAPPATDDFDLGDLALDLGDAPSTQTPTTESGADPLETKLALAEEFKVIGDDDGARALIEEVIAEATGDVKARAQAALAQL